MRLINKKYLKVLNISFQEQLEYKFNFISSLLFPFIHFAVNSVLWASLLNNSTSNSFGYTLNEMITYLFMIIIIQRLVADASQKRISNDIRTGEINKYLMKPINYTAYNIFSNLPRRANFILFGSLPMIIIGILLRGYLEFSISIKSLLFFIISIIIGYCINFLINFLLGISSFYFNEISSIYVALNVLKTILTGGAFPLSILPKPIYNISMYMPFQYIVYLPSSILQNRFTDQEIIKMILIGILWIGILSLAYKIIWKNGLKKYSAYGG